MTSIIHSLLRTTAIIGLACATLTGLAGCAASALNERAANPTPTESWARAPVSDAVTLNWLADFDDSTAIALIGEALDANFNLAEQRIRLEDSRQSVIVAGADRWPSLSASLDASRRDNGSLQSTTLSSDTDYGLNAAIAWELDIWGGLSASARAARLDYEADLAGYEAARRELVADTTGLVYSAIAAKQLLGLFEQRLANLQAAYEIVEGSYRRGLGNALDVYLAQNSIEQQRETVAGQQQQVLEDATRLQLALARYPDGRIDLPSRLPLYTGAIPAGIPSGLLTRRQDIRSAWLNLLAADARLAVAHKNRFPRLVLSGNGGKASTELSDLLDAGSSWSVASALSQTLFSGGRLRAAEAQARARVEALEQQYLALVYQAFADVENAISRMSALEARFDALRKAEQNADAALELSFDQYQRGLIPYTTVLEAQRRYFDAGTSLVNVQNELVQNRVTLYRALGGEFQLDE